ncbi:unnamed protein product [Arabidopsis halleri]
MTKKQTDGLAEETGEAFHQKVKISFGFSDLKRFFGHGFDSEPLVICVVGEAVLGLVLRCGSTACSMRGSGSRRRLCLLPLLFLIWAPAKAFCGGVGRVFFSLMVLPSFLVEGGDGIWWIRVCGLVFCLFVPSLALFFNSLLG